MTSVAARLEEAHIRGLVDSVDGIVVAIHLIAVYGDDVVADVQSGFGCHRADAQVADDGTPARVVVDAGEADAAVLLADDELGGHRSGQSSASTR